MLSKQFRKDFLLELGKDHCDDPRCVAAMNDWLASGALCSNKHALFFISLLVARGDLTLEQLGLV